MDVLGGHRTAALAHSDRDPTENKKPAPLRLRDTWERPAPLNFVYPQVWATPPFLRVVPCQQSDGSAVQVIFQRTRICRIAA